MNFDAIAEAACENTTSTTTSTTSTESTTTEETTTTSTTTTTTTTSTTSTTSTSTTETTTTTSTTSTSTTSTSTTTTTTTSTSTTTSTTTGDWEDLGNTQDWFALWANEDGSIVVGVPSSGFIQLSTNQGDTWSNKDTNQDWTDVDGLPDASIILAVAATRLVKSTDGGVSWTAVTPPPGGSTQMICCSPASTSTFFVGTSNAKIFKTTDGGANWTEVYTSSGLTVSKVRVAKTDTSLVFASTIAKYFLVSTDSGDTFTEEDAIRDWERMAINDDGAYIFTSVGTSGVRRSKNFGNTSQLVLSSPGAIPWAIGCSGDGQIVVEGTAGASGGIKVSEDGGDTWNPEAPTRVWFCACVSQDGSVALAGVAGGHIFRRPF